MKNILLMVALISSFVAYSQPRKLIKNYNLKEQKLDFTVNTDSSFKIALPRVYVGKFGRILYTHDKQTIGWTVDSVSSDTTYYNFKTPKSSKNAMRSPDNQPSKENDMLEVPQELLDKVQQMPALRAEAMSVQPIKVFRPYYVLDNWSLVNDFGNNINAATDWIIFLHTVSMEFSKAGGQDINSPIAGIFIYTNKNIIDSLWDDTRYTIGSRMNSVLYKIADLFWRAGGETTEHLTTRRMSAGGLQFRNPTLNRAGAAGIINCNKSDATAGISYTFGKGALAHEMLLHGLGLRHTFNCTDYTSPTGIPMKIDSSYNEGPCNTIIKPIPNGDIGSYQHLLQYQGGGIVARWLNQCLNQSWINLANTSAISGVYLGGSTLLTDSVNNKDNTFKIFLKAPANMNATSYELWENGKLITSGLMTQASLNATFTHTRPNGNYYYTAYLVSDRQRHISGGFTVNINKPVVTVPCTTNYIVASSCWNNTWRTRNYTQTGNNCTTPPMDSLIRFCPIQSVKVQPSSYSTNVIAYQGNTLNRAFDGDTVSNNSRFVSPASSIVTMNYTGNISSIKLYFGFLNNKTYTSPVTRYQIIVDDVILYNISSNTKLSVIHSINRNVTSKIEVRLMDNTFNRVREIEIYN